MTEYEKLRQYCYIVHPDLSYLDNNYYLLKDINSINQNLIYGVHMDRDPDIYGNYFYPQELEDNNFDFLRYFEEKYKEKIKSQKTLAFPNEGIPIYLIKYPKLFEGTVETDDPYLLPMPFYSINGNEYSHADKSLKHTAVSFLRTHPWLTYGVYSKDLGGLIKSPSWTPIIEPVGYTFSKYAYKKLRECGEKELADFHLKNGTLQDIFAYQMEHDKQIYFNHDTQKVYNRYKEVFDDQLHAISLPEKNVIFNAYLNNWDITSGLTPGIYSTETREMLD